MKKALGILIALCILLSVFSSFAAAETAEDLSAVSGVDVVIVLDMTKSMTDKASGENDVNGYRLDATAMLIGMLDMDGSRVAIVPFTGSPRGVIELTEVNSEDVRKQMISSVYGLNVEANTNIGAALMRANQILENRGETKNKPMIVLLTDGQNSINGTVTVDQSWRWDKNTNQLVASKESFNTAKANEVTVEAVGFAADRGFPIYTVALTQDPGETPPGGISLKSISASTGVEYGWAHVTKQKASELPSFFAKVLADMIGSSVEEIAEPELVEGTSNRYRVKIPVLNSSVIETNVIIPVKSNRGQISKIDSRTIEVLDAKGKFQTQEDGVTILSSNGHFVLVKIRTVDGMNRDNGDWTIQFASEDQPVGIRFNILYKYDIHLSANIAKAGSSEQDFYKNDRLTLTAQFVDSSNTPSEDKDLYTETDYPEEWKNIKLHWILLKDGEEVRSGILKVDPNNKRYQADINLAAAEEGQEPLTSGTYVMHVHAEGAGLNRTAETPIVLKNHEPVVHTDKTGKSITVNSPGDAASWEEQSGTLDFKATEIVTDEDDAGNLTFWLDRKDGADQPAVMTLEEDGTINYKTTVVAGKDGKNKNRFGNAVYLLGYRDEAGTSYEPVEITLKIISDSDKILEEYTPELTINGTPSGDAPIAIKKNTDVTFAVKLKGADGNYDDGTNLSKLNGAVTITDTKTGNPVPCDELTLKGDTLECTVNTGNKAAEWDVSIQLDFYEEPLTQQVSIPNNNPPKSDSKRQELILNCDGGKVPGFLRGIIGKDTPEDDPSRVVLTGSLFTDDDNDQLTISAPVFNNVSNGKELPGEEISAQKDESEGAEEGRYLIRYSGKSTGLFHYSFSSRMVITAEDGDGETAEYTRIVTVVDLYNKMLTYIVIALIAIAALVILYLIVHQIRKPKFPLLNMTIREEPSIYESGSETLSPVKTPTNANAVGVDSDMAAKHSISMELLQNIIISPLRSATSVDVCCKKLIAGHEVLLDDVQMKQKKHYVWRTGQELSIRSLNGEGLVAIKLEDRSADNDVSPDLEFGGEGDWSTETEVTVGSTARKHSRKVEKKAKTVQEDSTASGSNDDFDF